MDINITIKGTVTIPDDDLDTIQAQGINDLATILVLHGKDVKTDIREVYVSEKKGGK